MIINGWKNKRWGILFTGSIPGEQESLLGEGWCDQRYELAAGSDTPSRALLFNTRRQARAWCEEKTRKWAGNSICAKWHVRPVRVLETVEILP